MLNKNITKLNLTFDGSCPNVCFGHSTNHLTRYTQSFFGALTPLGPLVNQTVVNWDPKCSIFWAVVVAQLVEQSLRISEVRGSNPVIAILFYGTFVYCRRYWKDESKEKEAGSGPPVWLCLVCRNAADVHDGAVLDVRDDLHVLVASLLVHK